MPASAPSRRSAPVVAPHSRRGRWSAISFPSSASSGFATRSPDRRSTIRTSARAAGVPCSGLRKARFGPREGSLATLPVDDLQITHAFGPHLSANVREGPSDEPDRLVKTHCCFCGQQCGIQLKVKGNRVIGFEPWEDFPFNRGMLCPKGVKRYLQANHPDRLLDPLLRTESGFAKASWDDALDFTAR